MKPLLFIFSVALFGALALYAYLYFNSAPVAQPASEGEAAEMVETADEEMQEPAEPVVPISERQPVEAWETETVDDGEEAAVAAPAPAAPGVEASPEAIAAEVVFEAKPQEAVEVASGAQSIVYDIEGFNYAYNLNEITVNEGDTVTINFKSTGGFHDWVVDEFDAATTKVSEGDDTTSVTFVADKAGSYEYYCSVGSHRAQGMIGTLIVQ